MVFAMPAGQAMLKLSLKAWSTSKLGVRLSLNNRLSRGSICTRLHESNMEKTQVRISQLP